MPVEQEQRFVEMARQDGMPDFSVRSLNPHDGDRFIIQYIYPIAPNKQAIGLDIGSELNRRNAALASAREDRAYLSEPITLVQADKKARRGVLIMLPIFPSDATLQTPEAREQNVVGWSYAPLIIDDVLSGLSLVIDHAQIQLSNQRESTPFYVSDSHSSKLHLEDKMVGVINVLGQEWKLEIIPNDVAYMSNRWDIQWVVIIGSLMSTISDLAIKHAPEAIYPIVTVSVGFSTLEPMQCDFSTIAPLDVVSAADKALYQSKHDGRNRYSYQALEV